MGQLCARPSRTDWGFDRGCRAGVLGWAPEAAGGWAPLSINSPCSAVAAASHPRGWIGARRGLPPLTLGRGEY